VVDAARVVDVHRQPLGPAELDREHLDIRQPVFDGGRDLALKLSFSLVNLHVSPRKKWAPGAHFS
jgi:hypothetical protein